MTIHGFQRRKIAEDLQEIAIRKPWKTVSGPGLSHNVNLNGYNAQEWGFPFGEFMTPPEGIPARNPDTNVVQSAKCKPYYKQTLSSGVTSLQEFKKPDGTSYEIEVFHIFSKGAVQGDTIIIAVIILDQWTVLGEDC